MKKWTRIKHRPPEQRTRLSGSLHDDVELIRRQMSEGADVDVRPFRIGDAGRQAALVFVRGIADTDRIHQELMRPLLHTPDSIERIDRQLQPVGEVTKSADADGILNAVLNGWTALLLDGHPEAFLVCTRQEQTRDLQEALSEPLVRGPRIGFTESLNMNMALLRQQGANPGLTLFSMSVGVRARKRLVVAYIRELAAPDLVREVRRRIRKINIDHVPESGYIEQLIEDDYLSPFPQVQSTERPDRVMGALMEGRVAILLDGTPFALIVPVSFNMLLQSPEDYYERWLPVSLLRVLRYIAAFLSLFGPSLYIAFISFHPGLIPTKLVISIIGMREGVPFPALIEAIIMEVSIEILREAGLRLPKPIGPAVGIVGGLIIGEAAVQAGIVSSIMVIVVSLTAISSFAIPQYSAGIALRMLRFGAMFFAAVLGLYGVVLFFLLLCSHLAKLKSFGLPYTSPTAPYRRDAWKDMVVRMPLMMMKLRPRMLHSRDRTRIRR